MSARVCLLVCTRPGPLAPDYIIVPVTSSTTRRLSGTRGTLAAALAGDTGQEYCAIITLVNNPGDIPCPV